MSEEVGNTGSGRAGSGIEAASRSPVRNAPYPVVLRLEGKRCLVVGGGPVAAHKAAGLLASGARVRLVAPRISAGVRALLATRDETGAARSVSAPGRIAVAPDTSRVPPSPRSAIAVERPAAGLLQIARRRFHPSDLRGVFLAIAATNDRNLNRRVFGLAEKRRILANTVDQPDLCRFYAPAALRRGDLCIAISTNGRSPLLARRLRERLEAWLPADWERGLERLQALRSLARRNVPGGAAARAEALRALFDDDALDLLLAGRDQEFAERTSRWFSSSKA
jgi:precorrin-2 dehydrogenase/sirohydrochlorin ferrochelatase